MKLKRYRKDYSTSYTFGVFPTLELLAHQPDSLRQVGSLLGTGGIVVMDETACMVRAAIVIARFFRHETCGQCTQCREGTAWLYKLLRRIEAGEGTMADLQTIEDVGGYMEGQTICALSDAAAWAATDRTCSSHSPRSRTFRSPGFATPTPGA